MNETQLRAPGVDTRSALLEAARHCVRQNGLAGATSRQITARAGANLAAITYHFGSKDQLVTEALFEELQWFCQPALDALAGPGAPAELMLGVIQQLLAQFERSKDEAPVYLEALLMAARRPEAQDQARRLYSAIGDQLAGVIADLVDQGLIPAWVGPTAMSSLIMAVANGIVLQTQLDPAGPDAVAMVTQFAGLLLASGAGLASSR
jgi:AcrR family transcriptional regulator